MMAGKHRARAIPESYELGVASTGSEQVALAFSVIAGECEGEEITWYGSFGSEKSSQIALKALRTAGWSGDDITSPVGIGDTEVVLVVEEDSYNGEVKLRVKWVNRPGAGGLSNPMTEAQRIAFGKRMRAQLGAGASQPAKGASPLPGARRADDIPF